MFSDNSLVSIIGSFKAKTVNKDFIEMDSWEKGTEKTLEQYENFGMAEFNSDGTPKNFDGFQEGDFFKFNGKYQVVRSNELFTKVEIEGQLVSFPNHKLQEVD